MSEQTEEIKNHILELVGPDLRQEIGFQLGMLHAVLVDDQRRFIDSEWRPVAKDRDELSTALAAKEARIELLDGRIWDLESALRMAEKHVDPDSGMAARIEHELTRDWQNPEDDDDDAQQQIEPATHSEDGRECIARAFITGESGNGEYRVVMKFETLADMQSAHNYLVRAQPARHVGGGIKEAVTMDGKTTIREYVAGAAPEDTPMDEWTKGYEECKRRINRMLMQPCNQGAALAPAAVAVVMPERAKIRGYVGDDPESEGFNAALDEVARLNRRAIPVGLLEQLSGEDCVIRHIDDHYHIDGWRCIHCLEDCKTYKDFKHAEDCPTVELRALLGQEGE